MNSNKNLFTRLSQYLLLLILAGVGGLAGLALVIWSFVIYSDSSDLEKDAVKARIFEETTIYMLDEKTPIGSFFDDNHRRYIKIEDIPIYMINAIVAAEDQNFYNHHGVDPVAILSAVAGFLKSGRLRGASGITQQTVKNIKGDWEFSFKRKFREAIAALQLERLYPKRQILEFYLNQFYVSGNGKGISIASKYYFNKNVKDLNLVEAAFIAGSVKGPSKYDPFIKYSKKSRDKAIQRAFNRKNYVLKRMYNQAWIDKDVYEKAKLEKIVFKRGRFRSKEVALVGLIKTQLKKPEIMEALGIDNIKQLNQAGFKIYSTIDQGIQAGSQLSMQRNLSRLQTILDPLQKIDNKKFSVLRNVIPNHFNYAKIVAIKYDKGKAYLEVNYGLPNGIIPYESLVRFAKLMDYPYGKGWKKQLKVLLKKLKIGDVVYTEIKEYDADTQNVLSELKSLPQVNGGLIVLDKGNVRAVISGFETSGFNRAITAKRQPGSVFKPLVFNAALQLGWSILDKLNNKRQIFPFQGKYYFPRGDHVSPYSKTSMLWAGIMSENLASVYLTYNLLNKLNFQQFKELIKFMGLEPLKSESLAAYHYRVARKIGVQLDNNGVREFQLRKSLDNLVLDLQFSVSTTVLERLQTMWWGSGYMSANQAVYLADPKQISAKRKAFRLDILKNNYKRFNLLSSKLKKDWEFLKQKFNTQSIELAMQDPQVAQVLSRFRKISSGGKPSLGYFTAEQDLDNFSAIKDATSIKRAMSELKYRQGLYSNTLYAPDVEYIFGSNEFNAANIPLNEIKIDGWFDLKYFSLLSKYLQQNIRVVNQRKTPYAQYRYYQHHDFRIALGLHYLIKLSKILGVKSKMNPVLSFPLGTNDVSVAEVAKIYQSFVSGKAYKFYKEGSENQLNYIVRIEDRFGNVLYEPKPEITQVIPYEDAIQIREILRRIVTHGTGSRARGELFVDLDSKSKKPIKIRVPAFGKTGTTNNYVNAYFSGFIPYPTENNAELDIDNSYVISSYVGYDNNKSMKAGRLRISGAQGALPVWIGASKAIIKTKDYKDYIDRLDLSMISKREWPVKADKITSNLTVDFPRGIILNRSKLAQEVYNLTTISESGDSYINEYKASSVNGSIRIPLNGSSIYRKFNLFKDNTQNIDFNSSEIDSKNGKPRNNKNLLLDWWKDKSKQNDSQAVEKNKAKDKKYDKDLFDDLD